MKIRIYLAGQQYIDHEGDSQEVNRILAEYDNTEKSRIMLTDGIGFWHLAKCHIIAISVEPRPVKRAEYIPESPTKH